MGRRWNGDEVLKEDLLMVYKIFVRGQRWMGRIRSSMNQGNGLER